MAYAHLDDPVVACGYGVRDASRYDSCVSETTFCVGSITKQFTTAGILQLAATGRLDLDEDVAVFFPSQRLSHKGISLRHLLSHTAGLSANAEKAFCLDQALTTRPEEILGAPIDTEPGVSWRYCNTGFAIAARVMEEITGETYEDRLSRGIFETAQLSRTGVGFSKVGPIARGHARTTEGFAYVSPVPQSAAFGSGDIYSTAPDLVSWFKALSSGKVIPIELYCLMRTPFVLKSGKATSYGLGMFVSEFGGNCELSQDGNSGGFSSQLACYPDHDLFVAVLTNGSAHDAEGLEKSITRAILSIPEQVVLDLEVSAAEATAYSGDYDMGAAFVRIWADSGALFISKPNGRVNRLLNQGSGIFAEADTPDVRIRFGAGAATVCRNDKTLATLERSNRDELGQFSPLRTANLA